MVNQEQIETFQRDGVVPLYGVFADWVEDLAAGVDRNMAEPGPFGRFHRAEAGGGRFLSDYRNWDRIDQYRNFIFNSPAAKIGQALMGADEVRLFHEHVLVKEAQTGLPTPWHQDAPYYCVDAPKSVSIWIPLDPIPRDRTLEFVGGSHLDGKYYKPHRFNGAALNDDDGLEVAPDIEADRSAFNILGWALDPGDAVAFDYRILHGAPPNTSASMQRRAFSLRLVGEGATFQRRVGITTSPPFEEITLASGAPLEGETFPRLI